MTSGNASLLKSGGTKKQDLTSLRHGVKQRGLTGYSLHVMTGLPGAATPPVLSRRSLTYCRRSACMTADCFCNGHE